MLSKKKRVNVHSIFTTFVLYRGVTSVITQFFFREVVVSIFESSHDKNCYKNYIFISANNVVFDSVIILQLFLHL